MAILRTTLITNLHVRKNCYCINLLNTQKFRFNFIMYNGRAMKYNFNSTVLFVTFETVITNQKSNYVILKVCTIAAFQNCEKLLAGFCISSVSA